jgi:hypothetical protein
MEAHHQQADRAVGYGIPSGAGPGARGHEETGDRGARGAVHHRPGPGLQQQRRPEPGMGEDPGFRDHPGAVTRLLGISSAPFGFSDLRTLAVLRVFMPRSRVFPITGCPDVSITRSWTSPSPGMYPTPSQIGVHFSD